MSKEKQEEENDLISLTGDIYYSGWKLMSLHPTSKPKGVKQWLNFIWGFDIFIYKIPFMKTLILANIIIWLLF